MTATATRPEAREDYSTETAPTWPLSLLVLAAMVCAAGTMSAVFADLNWLPPIILMLIIVQGIGAMFRAVPRLQASGLAVLAQTVAGLLAIIAITVPQTTIVGFLPTPSSFPALLDTLGRGIDDLYSTNAPAESTPGFSAILAVGFALVAVLTDGLVADLKAPKVSGILLFLVYLIPVLLAPSQLRWWHFALIALAFLILIATPYLFRGRIPWTVPVAALAALLIGVVLPSLLPPPESRSGDGGAGPQGDLTVVNPFLDLRRDLSDRSGATVMTYTSTEDDQASPIRLTTADQFDGQVWQPSAFDIDPFAVANEGLPQPAGLGPEVQATEETLQVSVTGLDQQYLPAIYPAVRTNEASRRWIYDARTLNIVGNGVLSTDQTYSLDYLSVKPTAEQLRGASQQNPGTLAPMLELPQDFPQVVRDTADEVTAGAETKYDAAVMLQAYFRSSEFTYSLDAPEEASNDALTDFLRDKRGYCVQFSGAMTAMARHLEIPARIAVGFTAGDKRGDGSYEIKLNQAHSWPELYFPGVGWTRFEPTPGNRVGEAPPWSVAGGQEEEEAAEEEATSEPTEQPSDQPAPPPPEETQAPQDENAGAATDQPSVLPLVFGIVGAAILAVLLVLIPALIRARRRNARLNEASPESIWAELRDSYTDAGREWDRSRTVRDQAEDVAGVAGQSAPTAHALADAVDEERYAGAVRTKVEPAQLRELATNVRSGLAGGESWWRRAGTFLLPRSVLRRR